MSKDNFEGLKDKFSLGANYVDSGLSSEQVGILEEKYGRNAITKVEKNTVLDIFLKQFQNFIIVVLLLAAGVSYIADEMVNFYVILLISFIVIILGFVQEYRAEKSVQALTKIIKRKTTVIRNGKKGKVDVEEIVPGDLLYLESGDKVPADAWILDAKSLKINESTLTGESLPVEKEDGGEVFAGTEVVNGNTKCIVLKIGDKTEFGKIAEGIQIEEDLTPLQKNINKLTRQLAIAGIGISFLASFMGYVLGGDLHEVLILALTLSVATIPEGLPLTLTVTLMHGTRKLASQNALIRKLVGVETLGACTYICTDKTGTLTQNKMTVKKLYFDNHLHDIKGDGYDTTIHIDPLDGEYFGHLLNTISLNNNSSLISEDNKVSIVGDPTEAALLVLAEKYGLNTKELINEAEMLKEYVFTSSRKMMSKIVRFANGEIYLYAKGAPEFILNKSTRIFKGNEVHGITKEDIDRSLDKNSELAKSAYRNLGIGYKRIDSNTDLEQVDESDLTFLGIVSMIDPARAESRQAVAECRRAGINVVMITGDNRETAVAIAKEVGILDEGASKDQVMDGEELGEISESDLEQVVTKVRVYARVRPEQKLNIVKALQSGGEVVAMTGDGVNDSPALKKADIGVAMGITGTDVSKEASTLILEDDNFATIVNAVRLGRGVYENIEKFIVYLVSQNFNEIILIILALILLGPELLPLTAIQILFINTFDEVLPSLSLGFDKYRDSIMSEGPRDKNQGLLTRKNLIITLSSAAFMAISSFVAFYISDPANQIEHARTVVFLSVSLMILFRPYSFKNLKRSIFARSLFDNKGMLLGSAFALLVALLFIYVPFLEKLIGLEPLAIFEWYVPLVTSILSVIWIEATKYVVNRGYV